MLDFTRFVVFNILCVGILWTYHLVQFLIALLQQIPFVSTILWWPKFFAFLWLDPGGRSIYSILCDPRFRGRDDSKVTLPKSNRQNRQTRRFETSKQARKLHRLTAFHFRMSRTKKIYPVHSRLHSLSSYTTQGAFANIGRIEKHTVDASKAIAFASSPLYFKNPFGLVALYKYCADWIPDDLPNTIVVRSLNLLAVFLSFMAVICTRLCLLAISDFNKEQDSLLDGTFFDESTTNLDASASANSNTTTTVLTSYFNTHFAERYAVLMSGPGSRDEHDSFFDTDGITFVIDNSATCIICNDKSQFIGNLREQSCIVETANGGSSTSWVGTIRLTLTDDSGKNYTYHIPNAIYDKHSPFNIIGIPCLGDYFGKNDSVPSSDDDGTYVKSSATKSVLTWDHGKHTRHFTHSDKRLPELTCDVGYGYFQAFATRISRQYNDTVHYAFSSAHTVSPEPSRIAPPPVTPFTLGDEYIYHDGNGRSEACVYEGESVEGNHILRKSDGTKVITPASHIQEFNQPTITNVPTTPLEYCQEIKNLSPDQLKKIVYPRKLSPIQQEFLSWHNRLFHMPFYRMYKLIKMGVLPKRLEKCFNEHHSKIVCISCQFGKAHRRPWRTKGSPGGSIRKASEQNPGDGTSVDQIVSAQPGLVPQMAGALTSDRIWGATIFVDHVTNYVYCHLMKALNLEETLIAKKAYEKHLSQMGHSVKHYRADNGRFHDQGFIKDVHEKDQTIDFCAVGHHGQNGIVESKNKELTNGARTLLLHGIRMWPQMIDSMFWPFALKAYAERLNCLQVDQYGQTPESRMTGVSLQRHNIQVSNYHTLFAQYTYSTVVSKLQEEPGHLSGNLVVE